MRDFIFLKTLDKLKERSENSGNESYAMHYGRLVTKRQLQFSILLQR